MFRTFVRTATFASALLLLATLTCPYWFPSTLRLLAPSIGLDFQSAHRNGYARLVLENPSLSRPNFSVSASRLETAAPNVWLAKKLLRRPPGHIAIGHWRLLVSTNASVDAPAGLLPLSQSLASLNNRLVRHLPPADAASGVVLWPGHTLAFDALRWADATLSVRHSLAQAALHRDIPGNRWILVARSPSETWYATAFLRDANLSHNGTVLGQPLSATAA
ncbi:MAG: hypothetical protein LBR12_04900, partial [Opitutaceae bacterium]|nr:hypothetical protein [Opitutaceae bacterium]